MKSVKTSLVLTGVVISMFGCNSLVNRMAFHPEKGGPDASLLPSKVKEVFFQTDDGLSLQSYFLKESSSRYLLIYFHGNAGNISHRLEDLIMIHSFRISVLGVSYRGYGKSQGKASEKGLYEDGRAVVEYAVEELGFKEEDIIVLGRSIGTTVAIEISQNVRFAGLVLVSPLTSAREHARVSGLGVLSSLAGDAFSNIDKIGNVKCPVLVVHGTEDSVIPLEMGRQIYLATDAEKYLETIDGAGHNDLSATYGHKYWPPIRDFIDERMK